jgi:hypothetical protein
LNSSWLASRLQEVTIRRRPPHGIEAQNCGPVDFKVPLQGAQQLAIVLSPIIKAARTSALNRRCCSHKVAFRPPGLPLHFD